MIWLGVSWPFHGVPSHMVFYLVTPVSLKLGRNAEPCYINERTEIPRSGTISLRLYFQTEGELVQTRSFPKGSQVPYDLLSPLPTFIITRPSGDTGPHSPRACCLHVLTQILSHCAIKASWAMNSHFLQLPYVKKRKTGHSGIVTWLRVPSCIAASAMRMPGAALFQCVCTQHSSFILDPTISREVHFFGLFDLKKKLFLARSPWLYQSKPIFLSPYCVSWLLGARWWARHHGSCCHEASCQVGGNK